MTPNFKDIINFKNLKILVLVVCVILGSSIQHITLPILVTYYESLYFILIVSSIEGCFNYFIFMINLHVINKKKFKFPQNMGTIILCGIINALMSLCFFFSANPMRTPPIIQSIFLGMAIIPTVVFRNILLNKKTTYNIKFIIPSLILLFVSVIVATIPLFLNYKNINAYSLGWILLYLVAIILLSLDNTMQEKYIVETDDNSIINKVTFAFFTSLFQFLTLLSCFWIEYIFGYSNNPFESFINSTQSLINNISNFLILEAFIYDCLFLYVASIFLNSYSTNYNMMLTNLTNQSVALFFSIFPYLNNGIKAPLYILMPSLALNIISVTLWIYGEDTNHSDNNLKINEINTIVNNNEANIIANNNLDNNNNEENVIANNNLYFI